MTDELIIDVKLNQEDAEKDIEMLAGVVNMLVEANQELLEINKELEAQGKKNSTEYQNNAREIQKNSEAIEKSAADRKALTNELKSENTSVGSLTDSNKKLSTERNNLNLKTADGKQRLKEINKELDSNKKATLEHKDATDKSAVSMGDFTGALDKAVPGLGGMVDGINKGTAAALRFIATPLGLIITAIVAALAALSQYFTRTEEGGDMLAKAMAQLGAIFNVLLDRLALVGGALVKVFSGDLLGGIDDLTNAFDGMGEEMAQEVKIAGELAEVLDELEDRERSHKVAASETTNQIKQLVIESKNRLLTEAQKVALLQKAFDLEVKQNAVLKKIRADQLNTAIRQVEIDFNQLGVKRKLNETDAEYAKRIIADSRLTGAARDKVAEAIINLNNVEGESLAIQEKITNQIDAQNIKQEEKKKKLEEVHKKQQELIAKELADLDARQLKYNNQHEQVLKNLEDKDKAEHAKAAKTSMARGLDAVEAKTTEDEKARHERAVKQKLLDQDKEDQKQKLANYRDAALATLDVAGDVFGKINDIRQMRHKNALDAIENEKNAALLALDQQFTDGIISQEEYDKEKIRLENEFNAKQVDIKRKAFEDNKKNQIVQTTIDTIQTAVAAYRSLAVIPIVGVALGIAAAAAALVYGYKKVDEIKSQQFVGEQGGMIPLRNGPRWVTVGGKTHAAGGTQYWGSDGNRFLLQKGEGLFVAKAEAHSEWLSSMSRRNQAHGGRSWFNSPVSYGAEGGQIATNTAIQQSMITQDMINFAIEIVKNMPQPRVAVDDIVDGINQKTEVVDKANIL